MIINGNNCPGVCIPEVKPFSCKGECELIIYPIGSNAKSLLFDSLSCIPGNTWAIKIYLNFKPKDR